MELEKRCPISGLLIKTKPEWQNLVVSEQYKVSFSRIGDDILLVQPSGSSKYYDPYKFYEIRDNIIKEEFENDNIIIMRDYSQVHGKASKKVRLIQKQIFLNERKTKKTLIFFSLNYFLKLVFKIGIESSGSGSFFRIVRNYEEAIRVALKQTSSGTTIHSQPKYLQNLEHWRVDKKGFSAELYKYAENVVITKATGFLKTSYLVDVLYEQKECIRATFSQKDSALIKVADYSESKGGTFRGRNKYLVGVNEIYASLGINEVITYICGAKRFVRIQLMFISKIINSKLVFVDCVEDALKLIDDDDLLSADLEVDSMVLIKKSDLSLLSSKIGTLVWGEDAEQEQATLPKELADIYNSIEIIKSDYNEMLSKVEYQKQGLEVAMSKAREANELKSNFFANMSHEIRTPLTGIMGMLDILKATDVDNNQKEYIDIISKSSDLLLTIVNDILDYSKLEVNKEVVEKESFKLKDVVSDSYKLFKGNVESNNVSYELHFDELADLNVFFDKNKLQQVLHNLINNAIKFTSSGSVKVCVLPQHVLSDYVEVKFVIEDTGIGISTKNLKSIFSPFNQEDSSVSRTYGGTGLGLSITKNLIELLGGTIEVSSTLGEGSLFTFTLGFEVFENTIKNANQKLTNIPSQISSKINVLFVGQKKEFTNELEVSLKASDIGIEHVNSSGSMLSVLSKQTFDLIIVSNDIDFDSQNICQELRAFEKKMGQVEIPLVLVVEAITLELKQAYELCNLSTFLKRPLLLKDITFIIENYVDVNFIEKKREEGVEDANDIENIKDVIDIVSLRNRLLNDNNLISSVIDEFVTNVPVELEYFKKLVHAHDFDKIKSQIHLLKNYMGAVSSIKIDKLLVELKVTNDKGIGISPELIDILSGDIEEVLQSLSSYRKQL